MIVRLFTAHPRANGLTYLGHMRVALWLAWSLGLAAGGMVLHALLPFLCNTAASTVVSRLHTYFQEIATRADKSKTKAVDRQNDK